MIGYHLYIHIPFCRSRCPYCDFYSLPYEESLARQYINILSKEIRNLNINVTTTYIGGGTPTVLSSNLLDSLLKSMERIIRRSKEVTIEANPESLTDDKLKLFLKKGINRISIGVQSLREDKLKLLGRIHSPGEGIEAVYKAKRIGFKNINVDLIYGVPYETLESWRKELKILVKLPVTHISCYSLTLDESTSLYKLKEKIDEETVAQMFLYNMNYLPRKGFYHYEVSNFAKRNYQCKHNLAYWDNAPYIGLGPSAVSFIEGRRVKNVEDIQRYIEGKNSKKYSIIEERLSPLRRAKETVCLNLRRKVGVEFARFRERTGFDFWEIEDRDGVRRLIKNGFLRYKKRGKEIVGLFLTKKGFLYADEVCSELI
ncbi:MAG: radical SAM family heme chaperone HemW [Candidatus Omnitrophica bacterium]|nr:radical SAM family heme chaperone HemW [Candidatus Omnitrophota bacterium]